MYEMYVKITRFAKEILSTESGEIVEECDPFFIPSTGLPNIPPTIMKSTLESFLRDLDEGNNCV